MLEYFIGAVYTLVSPVMDGIQLNDSYGLKNMKLWEQIKKIKNKFLIILYLLFLSLFMYDLYDMYYHFDKWGGDAFPWDHYQSKEAYALYSIKRQAVYLAIFIIGIISQNKHIWLGRILLMTPFWVYLWYSFFGFE